MHSMGWFGFPFGFPFFNFGMLFWIVLLIIGYLVYQDANKRGMNGLLWFILVILPMVGIIFLILYIVIRETSTVEKKGNDLESNALALLKERYAKGEINEEEYKKIKKELEE